MWLAERVRYSDVNWLPLLAALALAVIGVFFVHSACLDAAADEGWSREALRQLTWFVLGLGGCALAMHVPLRTWRRAALPLVGVALVVQLFMLVMADSSLVPRIKGQCNWIRIGTVNLQPSEFIKLAVLLACARILTLPQADAGRLVWVAMVALAGGIPLLLLAKEDRGGALTFVPMLVGLLVLAGMHLRWIALAIVLGVPAMAGTLWYVLTRPDAQESYLVRRIFAFWNPEAYALQEGFQTIRSLRSIGSGQWFGKGYGVGPQNNLNWLPEEHNDMIFAVIAEETGFIGSAIVVLLFLGLGLALLFASTTCRDRFGRLVIGGFACLIFGQACINLAVVTSLMPVTGVTLPFVSYGGSSLLALFIGLGMCLGMSAARSHQFEATRAAMKLSRSIAPVGR